MRARQDCACVLSQHIIRSVGTAEKKSQATPPAHQLKVTRPLLTPRQPSKVGAGCGQGQPQAGRRPEANGEGGPCCAVGRHQLGASQPPQPPLPALTLTLVPVMAPAAVMDAAEVAAVVSALISSEVPAARHIPVVRARSTSCDGHAHAAPVKPHAAVHTGSGKPHWSGRQRCRWSHTSLRRS